MNQPYEAPMLDTVGKADQVILGIASYGWDVDGSLIVDKFEYAPHELDEEKSGL